MLQTSKSIEDSCESETQVKQAARELFFEILQTTFESLNPSSSFTLMLKVLQTFNEKQMVHVR